MNLEEQIQSQDEKCYRELVKKELLPQFKAYNKEFKIIKFITTAR